MECNFSGWVPGTVEALWYDDREFLHKIVPYSVRLDGGSICSAPFDDDRCIRKTLKPPLAAPTKSDKLRFKVGDRVVCRTQGSWVPGKIVDTFYEDPKMGLIPYVVHMDDWTGLNAPFDDDLVIRKTNSSPIVVKHLLGSRVECEVAYGENIWRPGTVVTCHENWEKLKMPPYLIRYDDDGSEEQFFGPQECIQASKVPPPSTAIKKAPTLRFGVGDRVDCRTAAGIFSGTVIRQWYGRGMEFEAGHKVPYQIQLDFGHKIYAPADNDGCLSESTVPAPDCWICFDNEQSESNIIVRDCTCRGQGDGFAHIGCLVKLAISKTKHLDCFTPLGEKDVNPFRECMTCKQRFDIGSHSATALAEACFSIYGHAHIGTRWNIIANRLMADSLKGNGDFDHAKRILQTQIKAVQDILATNNFYQPSNNGCLQLDKTRLEEYLHDNLLLQLADVHEDMVELNEMKAILDKVRAFTKSKGRGISYKLLLKMAVHAHLTGDKQAALKYYKQCTTLLPDNSTEYANVLVMCASLNLELGKKDLCINQLERALMINTPWYGSGSSIICTYADIIQQIREGLITKQLPLSKLGLGDLERKLRICDESWETRVYDIRGPVSNNSS